MKFSIGFSAEVSWQSFLAASYLLALLCSLVRLAIASASSVSSSFYILT
jgi:hypothetical protein